MRLCRAFAGLLFATVAGVQAAQADDRCRAEIAAVAEAADALSGVSEACRQHPYYHYLAGKAHIRAKRYDAARAAFDAGLAAPGAFEKALKLAVADIALHQRDYRRAASAYRAVTAEFPDWHVGFEYLGFALFALNDLDEARMALERSIRLQESADAYRTLTLVYYSQGEYEKSIDALNRGFSLNENLLDDRDFMVAGVRSYTELGRFDIARGLLAAMLKQNRALKQDPEFLRAGHYLRKKMVEKGVLKE